MRAVANSAEERKDAEWTKEEYLAHLAANRQRWEDQHLERNPIGFFHELDRQTRDGKRDWKAAVIGDGSTLPWIAVLITALVVGWNWEAIANFLKPVLSKFW